MGQALPTAPRGKKPELSIGIRSSKRIHSLLFIPLAELAAFAECRTGFIVLELRAAARAGFALIGSGDMYEMSR